MAAAEADGPILLVVEDDPIVRLDMADRLRRRGFRVLRVGSADHAARIIETQPEVRAVMSDLLLPGAMNGLALLRLVAERRPGCALVLVSGMGSPAAADMPVGTVFLSKPVAGSALDDALSNLRLIPASHPD